MLLSPGSVGRVWVTNADFPVTASQETLPAPFRFETSAPSKCCSIADANPGVGILWSRGCLLSKYGVNITPGDHLGCRILRVGQKCRGAGPGATPRTVSCLPEARSTVPRIAETEGPRPAEAQAPFAPGRGVGTVPKSPLPPLPRWVCQPSSPPPPTPDFLEKSWRPRPSSPTKKTKPMGNREGSKPQTKKKEEVSLHPHPSPNTLSSSPTGNHKIGHERALKRTVRGPQKGQGQRAKACRGTFPFSQGKFSSTSPAAPEMRGGGAPRCTHEQIPLSAPRLPPSHHSHAPRSVCSRLRSATEVAPPGAFPNIDPASSTMAPPRARPWVRIMSTRPAASVSMTSKAAWGGCLKGVPSEKFVFTMPAGPLSV